MDTKKSKADAAPAETVNIKLTQPHTHKREEKQPGDIIAVRPDQAERLVAAGRGVVV